MKTFLWIIGSILGIVAVIVLISGLSLGFRFVTAEIRGIVGMEENVQSADFRQNAYEHFYDLCATIQGHEATLEAQKNALEGAESSEDKSRIRGNIAGIQAQRARDIAQYNADARKNWTSGQFRSNDLPYELDREDETTC